MSHLCDGTSEALGHTSGIRGETCGGGWRGLRPGSPAHPETERLTEEELVEDDWGAPGNKEATHNDGAPWKEWGRRAA